MKAKTDAPVALGFLLAISALLVSAAPCNADARLSGTISDNIGAIVAHASIRLFSLERFLETTADENGRFTFAGVPAGTYELQATSPGFSVATIEGLDITDNNVGPLAISVMPLLSGACGSPHPARYEIKRQGESKLVGLISDYYSGKVLPAAEISVVKAGGSKTVVAAQKADSRGRFDFIDLPSGKYTLTASLKGFSALAATTFWVTPGSTTRVEFGMVPNGKVLICQ